MYRLSAAIRLPSAALEAIDAHSSMDESIYMRYKRQFAADRFSFFAAVKRAPDYRQLLLYLFLRFAADAYEQYSVRGIGDDVYFDTFSDIRIWCMHCAQQYGEYGIEEYNWLQEHVQLRLFRLGRLQFQPYSFDRDVEVDGTKVLKRQIVLNVHIPEGEPLDAGKVNESFARAGVFFRGITPVYVCHSWLLYPKLADILLPNSNILQFQRLFRIYDTDDGARQAEERIFGCLLDDPAAYEARTTLQRNAKAYLQAGGKLGNGYGLKLDTD